MGLREEFEKYDIITDEDIARGIVYAWTWIVVADSKVERAEMDALTRFAAHHSIVKQFDQADWLSKTVGEALNVYKTEGQESLVAIIKECLTCTNSETRLMLVHTLMLLAAVDGDFSTQEFEALNQIVEMLDIPRKDILMIGTLCAIHSMKE